jgi:hypothetical protein
MRIKIIGIQTPLKVVLNKFNGFGAGTAHSSRAPKFTPDFSWVRFSRSFVFCVVFGKSLFVLLSFFFWPLCSLSNQNYWDTNSSKSGVK